MVRCPVGKWGMRRTCRLQRILRSLVSWLKCWKTPTPDQVNKAVAQLGHGEYNRYFFDRLENPEWLGPLKAKGFLSSPPPPVHDEARGTIGFPPWPESRYLARMAKYAPET